MPDAGEDGKTGETRQKGARQGDHQRLHGRQFRAGRQVLVIGHMFLWIDRRLGGGVGKVKRSCHKASIGLLRQELREREMAGGNRRLRRSQRRRRGEPIAEQLCEQQEQERRDAHASIAYQTIIYTGEGGYTGKRPRTTMAPVANKTCEALLYGSSKAHEKHDIAEHDHRHSR